ncbi:hypothetical protein RHMOL_Rhmol12G0002600 [Rhododendron molle]|uniref:Uncharacterized protein n=1 Tax=Rhododendron molle TaxID=49168 RepID=A0ACC0LDV6_RHOML|nr:hypothetical protein RHMOL_Rhmol12G0002600 [Rhododendron molle]
MVVSRMLGLQYCIQNIVDSAGYSCIKGKKLFKVKIDQKLSSVNHVSRKIK